MKWKMRAATVAAFAAIAAACGGIPPIVIKPPKPPIIIEPEPPKPPAANVAVVFHVQDSNNHPLISTLTATSEHGPWIGQTNAAGDFSAELTPGHYDIKFVATGFVPRDLPADIADPGTITVGLTFDVKGAGERGWLRRDGKRVLNEDGSPWRGRGFTDFTLLDAYSRGVNITGLLSDRICSATPVGETCDPVRWPGPNYVRVLMMYDGGLGFLDPKDSLANLSSFLSLLSDQFQLRAEVTVFADAQKFNLDKHAYLDQVASITRQHWNALGELVNEAPQNGITPSEFSKPAGPTLWSQGSNLGDQEPYAGWDFLTSHPDRNAEWMRKVPCREYMDKFDKPCLEDEPMGAAEQPKNGRSNDAVAFGYLGGTCSLWATGCLFHSDGGVMGQPLGQVEHHAASEFFLGLSFAPADAPYQGYQRGNNCGDCNGVTGDPPMPLMQWDNPDPRGTLRTLCRLLNGLEYCETNSPQTLPYTPLTRGGWTMTLRTGASGSHVVMSKVRALQ